ncbi:MAG: rod shape-determining protein MreD [bacterium]
MKNKLYFLAIILLIIIIQTTHFDFWSIYSIKPDLILLTTCLFGLLHGSIPGVTFGFSLGFIQDVFSNSLFGAQSFSKALWGYASGQSVLKLDPQYPMVQLMLIFTFSLGDAFLIYILHMLFIGSAHFSNTRIFLFRTFGQIAYNLAIWPLVYPLGSKFFISQQEIKR